MKNGGVHDEQPIKNLWELHDFSDFFRLKIDHFPRIGQLGPFPKYELVCWLQDTANLRYPAIRKGTVRYWLFSMCVL